MDNVLTVEQVFAERLLRVPDYQRGYAWETRQLTDFTDDLEILPEGKSHYTGTLILHPVDSPREMDAEGKEYAPVDVVDGQQRLTTIVLFLNAIRSEMQEIGLDTLASGIHKTYISVRGLHGQPLMKLTLNRDANDFWMEQVLADNPGIEGPRIQSHRRLQGAADHFEQYLLEKRQELQDEYQEWLMKLYRRITHQLKVTLYNVTDTSDVGVIFEVMNDRGKPLTELEKVKNFLLYTASKLPTGGEHLAQLVNTAWRDILENLMRAGLTDYEDQLLRAHWLMSYEPQARLWYQSKSVKERFSLRTHADDLDRLRDELFEYTRSLQAASLAFCEVMHPQHPDAFQSLSDLKVRAAVRDATEKFRRTRQIAAVLPLVLAARLKFQERPDDLLEVLRVAEKFVFRVYVLMRAPGHSGQTILYRLGHLLYRDQADVASITQEIRREGMRLAPQHRFEDQFVIDATKDWYHWGGIKYLLYEYEEHLAGGREIQISWDQIEQRKTKTIEHILPQTPDDPYWTERFTEDEIELYTHDLGNLCLTFDNSVYQNYPFPVKRGSVGAVKSDGITPQPCYANSILMQEHRLAVFDDWTPTTVVERRNEMVSWALQRWYLEEPTSTKQIVEPADDELELDELGQPAGTAAGDDYEHATLTAEEANLSLTFPTRENPWVIQPYNRGLYRSGSKGYTGQCMYCDSPAKWSAKGPNRWFAMCTSHMSIWTGWEHRAGAESVEVTEDELRKRPTPGRRHDQPDWTWDRYLTESDHSKNKIDLVRTIADRISNVSGWKQLKYKQQIHLYPADAEPARNNRLARIQFWNAAPRLVMDGITLTREEDPLPDLPGNRLDKQGNGFWDFPRMEDVPLDLAPIVRLVEERAEATSPAIRSTSGEPFST